MIAYRRLIKELVAMLMPKQVNKGSGTVQAGRIDGSVTVINHHYGGTRQARRTTPDQKAVLQLMAGVPDRIAVLDFMEREFNTRMVIELKPAQLYRLRRYVEVVLKAQ